MNSYFRQFRAAFFVALLFVVSLSFAQGKFLDRFREGPIANTSEGPIMGKMEGSTRVFLGIPFAEPPLGRLRWVAPQPPRVRSIGSAAEIYKATKESSIALQMVPGLDKVFGSEDCLYLNIWAPQNPTQKKLPVMVWIHGGAFIIGGGYHQLGVAEIYNARALAEKGELIVVSFNYRLGVFGFLAHEELQKESPTNGTGNYGILDQIAALKWVKKNIANFGGDPDNLTVFGESAGGASVLTLLASPKVKDLGIKRLIIQSGPLMELPLKKALAIGKKIVGRLKPNPGSKSGPSLEELRSWDGKEILRKSQMEVAGPGQEGPLLVYAPVVDGDTLDQSIIETIESGRHNRDISVMIGTNNDEMAVLAPVFLKGVPKTLSRGDFLSVVKELLHVTTPQAIKLTQDFTPEVYGSNKAALKAFADEVMFQAPTMNLIRALEKHNQGNNFLYRFTEKLHIIGAGHGMELLYLFPNMLQDLTRFAMTYNPLKPWTAMGNLLKQKRLSDLMIRYWTRFAKSGDPNGGSDPLWPEARDGKALMDLNADRPGGLLDYQAPEYTERLAEALRPKDQGKEKKPIRALRSSPVLRCSEIF